MSYDQFSAKVGERLKVDPTHIRFSTVNTTTGKPKQIVKRNPNQNLWQILSPQFSTYNNSNQRNDALYYEVLDISLSELDTKKILKVTWVSEGVTKEVCISKLRIEVGRTLTPVSLIGNLRYLGGQEWCCGRPATWSPEESGSRR